MGREFELKFRATEEIQAKILEKYGPFFEISMETTYFDTPEGELSRRHITLRRRMENGVSVCTVKTPLGDNGRGEWELQWDDPETMVAELCKLGAPKEIAALTQNGIVPLCGARFTRKARSMPVPGGCVELAVDQGILLGGGKEIPLQEVEVELKEGDDQAALDFAQALATEFGLEPEPQSKFRRAMLLATDKG